jgi:tRNA(Ile)-lysidine synthetase-like protein
MGAHADAGSVLVGLSGGADSVALLLALQGLGQAVCACHINHGLRENAAQDEAFVRGLCDRLNVRLAVEKVQITGAGVEEKGREVRYAAYQQARATLGCTWVATGHTMDDQAETVLMNLCRGAGLGGLGGIPAVNGSVLRPLLGISREEVEDYLAKCGADFVTDESNASMEYLRNRVRHIILPAMEAHMNPQAKRNIAAAAARLAEDAKFLDGLAVEFSDGSALPLPLATRIARRSIEADKVTQGKIHEALMKKSEKGEAAPCPRAVKCAIVGEEVKIRTWQPGDRITLARGDGSTFTKKLQDIFTDDKIPQSERSAVPVLATATEVVAVLGQRPRVAAKFLPRPGAPTDTYFY